MNDLLLQLLRDPVGHAALRLAAGDLNDGVLASEAGRSFPVCSGIPRFVQTQDTGQKQTEDSFGFKWKQRETFESPQFLAANLAWKIQRYGFHDANEFRDYMSNRNWTLDAGCGAGFSATHYVPTLRGNWVGADISEAIDVARQRLGHYSGTHFVQADVMQLPFADGTFDLILAEGVLHHTPSTEAAIKALPRLLRPGGDFVFYVYRKKGPIREFTDDYIREAIAGMPPEVAWEALKPLTKLGEALGRLNVKVDVPEDIPLLEIKAGSVDVQRLFYWHVAKMFYRPDFSFDENHHVNFDWFHPRYAHRQTEEQVRRWCSEAGLDIVFLHAEESGFSVRARRN